MTRRLQEAGELIGIDLMDHIILGGTTLLQLQGRGTGVKVLYFDCFAGAAGDMILGALLDAGLPFDELKRALGSLAVEGWDVSVDRVIKTGVTATKFRVHEHAHQPDQRSRDSAISDPATSSSRSWPSFLKRSSRRSSDRR